MKRERPIVSIVKGDLKESPTHYTNKDLNIIKEMIIKSLDFMGGIKKLISGVNTIMLKPNLVEVPLQETGGSVLTDPRVLEAIISLLKDYGIKNVKVGEGKSVNLKHESSGSRNAFNKSGLGEAVKRAGGTLVYWDEEPFIPVDVPTGELLDKVRIPKSILDSDVFITVPKLKTHCQTVVTLGIKSMQGVYSVDDKVLFHNESFHWKMIDMLRVLKPDLTIIDGLICGEGYGPIYSTPVKMNLIVSSKDVVAADAVSTAIMGIDPFEVPLIRLAHTEGIGIGELKSIDIKGETIDSVMRHFERPAIWNPIGMSPKVKVFAGGACRFGLAQIGATLKRLEIEGELEKLDEICVLIGCNPPVPKKHYKNVFIIGDCAKDTEIKGKFIPGCPPLPSISIVNEFKKHKKRG